MATARGETRDQGKTGFVKEFLNKNPQGNVQAVNEAWAAAGKDGTIGSTLIQKMRSQMGLTGNLRAKPKPKAAAKKKPAPKKAQDSHRNSRQNELLEGVPARQSPRQRRSRECGLAGSGLRRDHQPRPREQDQSINGSDRQSSWEAEEDQDCRQGEGTLHRQEARAKAEGDHCCGQRATTRQEERSDHSSDRPRSRHRPASLQGDGDW